MKETLTSLVASQQEISLKRESDLWYKPIEEEALRALENVEHSMELKPLNSLGQRLPDQSITYLATATSIEDANEKINAIQEYLGECVGNVWISIVRSDDDRTFEVRVEHFPGSDRGSEETPNDIQA